VVLATVVMSVAALVVAVLLIVVALAIGVEVGTRAVAAVEATDHLFRCFGDRIERFGRAPAVARRVIGEEADTAVDQVLDGAGRTRTRIAGGGEGGSELRFRLVQTGLTDGASLLLGLGDAFELLLDLLARRLDLCSGALLRRRRSMVRFGEGRGRPGDKQ
jgi:hypothetical protein